MKYPDYKPGDFVEVVNSSGMTPEDCPEDVYYSDIKNGEMLQVYEVSKVDDFIIVKESSGSTGCYLKWRFKPSLKTSRRIKLNKINEKR